MAKRFQLTRGVDQRGDNTYRVRFTFNGARVALPFEAPSDQEAQVEGDRLRKDYIATRAKVAKSGPKAITTTIHAAIDGYIGARYTTLVRMAEEKGPRFWLAPDLTHEEKAALANLGAYRTATNWADGLKARIHPDYLMVDFDNKALNVLVEARKEETRRRLVHGKVVDVKVKSATVNRSITEFLRSVFNYYEKERGWQYPNRPTWENHKKREPKFRVAPISPEAYAALTQDVDPDYRALFDFLLWTGMRSGNAAALRWDQVTFHQNDDGEITHAIARLEIKSEGEEKEVHEHPLNRAAAQLLLAQVNEDGTPFHPEYFFTYVPERTRDGRVRGVREQINLYGFRAWYTRHREKVVAKLDLEARTNPRLKVLATQVAAVRLHDARHTLATQLAKRTRNPTIVRQTLGHRSVATTMKYMQDMTDETIAAGNQLVADNPLGQATTRLAITKDEKAA